MTGDVQLAVVGLLVGAAAVYLLRVAGRAWTGRVAAGCGSGCGGCNGPPPATPPQRDGRFPLPMV